MENGKRNGIVHTCLYKTKIEKKKRIQFKGSHDIPK